MNTPAAGTLTTWAPLVQVCTTWSTAPSPSASSSQVTKSPLGSVTDQPTATVAGAAPTLPRTPNEVIDGGVGVAIVVDVGPPNPPWVGVPQAANDTAAETAATAAEFLSA